MEDSKPIDILEDIIDKFINTPSRDPATCVHKIRYYQKTGKTLYCGDCMFNSCPFKPTC